MDEQVKKKRKWLPFAGAALAALVLGIVIWIVIPSGNEQKAYDEQISLAERFLKELDYDKAIAAYKAAMEIDPKRPDAYEGIVDAYLAKADAAADDDKALGILDEAIVELEQLKQSDSSLDFIEQYRVQVLDARLRFRVPDQTAQNEETPDEDNAEDADTVPPTESIKEEVTPTEKPKEEATPTESASPTPEPEDAAKGKKPGDVESMENLVVKHYQEKYFTQVGIENANDRHQIEGNMMKMTLIFLEWDGDGYYGWQTVHVKLDMDTGLCTDDLGESEYLW
ncbi:MAG: hypothetical protein K5697_11350 [Lachnospiraceae bacterium]|nr:hypothetical protein [Lachnospiraceae bacterium]